LKEKMSARKHDTHEKKRSPESGSEDDEDEVMHILKAYNFAEDVRDEWVKNCASRPEPLHFELFEEEDADGSDHEEQKYPKWQDEEASENESIPEFNSGDEDGDGGESTSEDEDSDNEAEALRWPSDLDDVHYRFSEEFTFTSSLMNKRRRKVYTALWEDHNKPVVVIAAQDLDQKRVVNGIPREVRIMHHLRNVPGVANVLGWCPVDKEKGLNSLNSLKSKAGQKIQKSKYFAIFMERYMNCDMIQCSQGNLVIIRKIMSSILQAVHNLHEHKVVHRDLAMDNIMWNPIKEEAVIIDFDTACFHRPQGYYRDVGRDKYDAPEKTEMLVLRRKLYDSSRKKPRSRKRLKSYTEKADIYSVGVIFWMLLTESTHSPDPYKLKRWVKKRKERGKHKRHAELDLLFKMLAFNAEKRPTPAEALSHAFFQEGQTEEEVKQRELYKEAHIYLYKMLDMNHPDEGQAEKKGVEEDEKKVTVVKPSVDDAENSVNSVNSEDSEDSEESEETSDVEFSESDEVSSTGSNENGGAQDAATAPDVMGPLPATTDSKSEPL
jgi:serine/threonine protein kinase